MTQTTQVVKIAPAAATALLQRLRSELPAEAEWRNTPHARFAVKAMGVVATCYQSGKLVVQGRDADVEMFGARFLGDAAPAPSNARTTPAGDVDLPLDVISVASDEAGKGDYFGPLVVAGVRAGPEHAAALAELRIADSKTLTDARARHLAVAVDALLDSELRVLTPPEYNARHGALGNVNLLLAELHAEVLDALAARAETAVSMAVVDRFAAERLVRDALLRHGRRFDHLVQVPRAERHLGVAAASILARAAFLDGLRDCADACGSDLHKGAGAPVDVAARRVVAIGGRELLGTVAKLHFRNTGRVLG